jgi:hypothetical protein
MTWVSISRSFILSLHDQFTNHLYITTLSAERYKNLIFMTLFEPGALLLTRIVMQFSGKYGRDAAFSYHIL